jgi:hypothetical protein
LETLLDSQSQKHPEMRELGKALMLTRSIQRTMVGSHYVKEWSLKRFTVSGSDPKKKNWRKHQRERAVKLNGTLFDQPSLVLEGKSKI